MADQMIIVETQVPEDIYLTLQACGLFREALAEQSRQLLALRFYQDRTLSLGQAAKLAGLNLWAFIDLLADYDIPVFDYNDEELAAEFEAAARLMPFAPKSGPRLPGSAKGKIWIAPDFDVPLDDLP